MKLNGDQSRYKQNKVYSCPCKSSLPGSGAVMSDIQEAWPAMPGHDQLKDVVIKYYFTVHTMLDNGMKVDIHASPCIVAATA